MTQEQFSDLAELALACTESAAPLSPYVNKRRHCRIKFPARVLLVELDDSGIPGAAFGGDAVDLSRSGIGVCTRRLYYSGRRVLVKITLPNKPPYVKCGTVRHARYCTGGLHHVGIEFCATPDNPAVHAWLRSPQALD